MERKNVVLLTVIAVATLLTAMVGSTFAYFTAQVSGTGVNKEVVNATTATVSATYTEGSNIAIDANAIDPSWSGTKKITIENTSAVDIDYTIAFDNAGEGTAYSNSFGNLEYKLAKATISESNNNEDEDADIVGLTNAPDNDNFVKMEASSLKSGSDNVLVTGHLGAGEKHEFELTIRLKDTGENQNEADAGKSFTGKLLASAKASKKID